MPLPLYCSLGRGAPEVGLRIYSYRSSLRIRFVLVSAFLPRVNYDVEQVIAPYLIVLRVADQSALTSKAVASGNVGSMHFRTQGESTTGNIETIPGVSPVDSEDAFGKARGEFGVGVQTPIDFHSDKV